MQLGTRRKPHSTSRWATSLFSSLLLFCNPVLALSQQTQEDPIRTSVNLVPVGVTVTDSAGKFVEHLRHENFRLSVDGSEQHISVFRVDYPNDVLILIEAGPAVYLMEGGHLQAASKLLDGLSAQDQVGVVKYADKPESVSNFSVDKKVVADALDHLNFNLGFGALNLSDSLSTLLDWMDQWPAQKTIVLLSTGVDTSAPESGTKLLQRLRQSDTRVLAVSLLGDLRTPKTTNKKRPPSTAMAMTTQQFDAADDTLRQLAAASGGRAYFPADAKGFASVYQEISEIVGHQYMLGYIGPTVEDEKVHTIDVQLVIHPQDQPTGISSHPLPLRVDHRQAYLAHKAANFSQPNGVIGQ